MEQRQLGSSGLRVPVLSLGTVTFGGSDAFSRSLGALGVAEARRLVDIALEVGLNLFDSSDIYSGGASEEILGQALAGRRQHALISTKVGFRSGPHPNDVGASRSHLIEACEGSLRRLRTDHIDVYQLHGFDALTPVDETLSALDGLVRSGKVRYVGCSNFSGWHLMQALASADRHGWPRYVAHQAYYSLLGRDYEWELMPLGLAEQVGAMVWSPLGWGRLTGRLRRGEPLPEGSRLHGTHQAAPPVTDEHLFRVLDAVELIATETGKTVPQVALNWLLGRPTVSTLILGARTEAQLRDNLGALAWQLTAEQLQRLDRASTVTPPYPYWHQRGFERNPAPVG